ncbi:MAG: prepilin peptidase, partial [Veillonellales bacterium]
MQLFFWGLLIGSFLNVCIYRLPRGESIVTPPSHCTDCGTRLKPWDMIPILSWLLLKGRCRYCGTAIPSRYAAIELLTGILFVWCLEILGLGPALFKTLVLLSFLLVITFIDYDHQLILDKVLLWFAPVGVAINLFINHINFFANAVGYREGFVALQTGLPDMLIGALLGGGAFLLIAVVSRGGMGGGDIKFAASLGLWLGGKFTLLAIFLSFLFGGLAGVLLLLLQRKGRRDMIPFGPFIALGAVVTIL